MSKGTVPIFRGCLFPDPLILPELKQHCHKLSYCRILTETRKLQVDKNPVIL